MLKNLSMSRLTLTYYVINVASIIIHQNIYIPRPLFWIPNIQNNQLMNEVEWLKFIKVH